MGAVADDVNFGIVGVISKMGVLTSLLSAPLSQERIIAHPYCTGLFASV